MDYNALAGVTSLATTTAAFAVIAFSMLYWENIALRFWALAELFGAVGGIVFAIYPPTTTSMGHTMLFAFYVFALKGIVTFFRGYNQSFRFSALSIGLYALVIHLMTSAGMIDQRIVLTMFLLVSISIFSGYFLLRFSWRSGCYVGKALGLFFFLHSSIYVFRIATVVFFPELKPVSLKALYLETVVSSILYPSSFILLVSEKMLRDREHEARIDPLTQVLNRRALSIAANPLLSRCQRQRKPLCAMVLDLDHFKKINDSMGHAAGDAVLKLCASWIQQSIRDQDVFARIGGEEFTLLLPDTPLKGGHVLAERLCKGYKQAVLAEMSVPSTFSVGIYCHEARGHQAGDDMTLDELLHRADKFLLEAKRLGRDRVISGTKEAFSNTEPESEPEPQPELGA